MPPAPRRARRLGVSLLAGLALAHLGVCIAFAAGQLGSVPNYADTRDYLAAGSSGDVPAVRGFLYPALLAAAAGASRPGEVSPAAWDLHERLARLPGVRVLQLVQVLACAACLAWFLHVSVDWSFLGRRRRRALAAVTALVALDPVVLHYGFALMTDSLALSASLVFCGALASLSLRRGPPLLAACLLVLGQAVAGGLRPEKNAVALATAALTALGLALWQRRHRAPRGLAVRGLVALGLSTLTFLPIEAARQARTRPAELPLTAAILHQRVVYPHLAQIRAALPEGEKQLISKRAARRHDRKIRLARSVLEEAAPDPAARARLVRELARTTLRERWLPLLLDVAKDATENTLATASFYARLAAARLIPPRVLPASRDGADWTLSRMQGRVPWLAGLGLASGAALFFATGAASVAGARAAPRERVCWALLPWLPAAAFTLVNAAAFALTQDLLLVRYALFGHAALLAALYTGALYWAAASGAGRRRPARADRTATSWRLPSAR